MNNEKYNRVVVLRFEDGIRVDIAINMTEPEAIADMAARAMASQHAPLLPLWEAVTSIIPAERAAELSAVIELRAAGMVEPVAPLPLPFNGLQAAMRAYGQAVIATTTPEVRAEAERALSAFFSRHGIAIDFSDGVPEWLRNARTQTPRNAAEAWTAPP